MKLKNSCCEDECVVELKIQVARLEEKINANEKAVFSSEGKIIARLEGLNEFRGVIKDQQATCISRNEFEAKHKTLEDKIDTLARFMWILIGGLAVVEFLLKFLK